MREPTTQICGGIIIFDFDGLALTHIMQFTPSFAAMILEWVQVRFIEHTFVRSAIEIFYQIFGYFVGGTHITTKGRAHFQQLIHFQHAVFDIQTIH